MVKEKLGKKIHGNPIFGGIKATLLGEDLKLLDYVAHTPDNGLKANLTFTNAR